MPTSSVDERWLEPFAQERTRLLAALGELIEGGIVEGLQHIGATSVPGLPASPCIDIGLAVWPFPLEPHRQATLEALGYALVSGYEGAPEQRFRHIAGTFQLFCVEAGSERWTDYLVLRDFLRHDEEARFKYAERKREGAARYPDAEAKLIQETLESARAWWIAYYGFGPVEAVARELEALPCAWHISSGWAIDLFLGRVTRIHHDVDVVLAREDQLALQEYMTARGWRFVTPYEGQLQPWPPQMRLELPRHQAHAHKDGAFIDFLFSEITDGVWRFRRNPAILRAADRISLRTASGLSFLAPEIVLLFKSRTVQETGRVKDRSDFENSFTLLEPERRAWLRWALTVLDPKHPWRERLIP